MIKVFDAFTGYGGFTKGLINANIPHKVIGWSEVDKYAIQCYKQNYSEYKDLNYGDITKIDEKELPDFDLFVGGFPCSPAGTLINTKEGYKEIQNVIVGDSVLTHKNRYCKVIKTMTRKSNHIYIIKSAGNYGLKLTEEHPLYVFRNYNFEWVKVKDLKKTDYLLYNINTNSKNNLNLNETECWLIGRYLADGSYDKAKDIIYFSIGSHKRQEFETYTKLYKTYVCHNNRNCQEHYITDNRLKNLCLLCGFGSKNKELPIEFLDLPKELLSKIIDGYISGDGHIQTKLRKRIMYTTISQKLVLSMQMAYIKVYCRLPSINIRKDKRKETFSDSYNSIICGNPRDSFVIGNKIASKIKSIERIDDTIEVYNLEVKNDNSYCCQNIITHNCQSFSIAGKRKGFEDTRGTLIFDVLRICKYKQPKWIVLENVKGLVNHDKGNTLKVILESLKEIGYQVMWKVLNTKKLGIPQNRERIFIVCFRNDIYKPLEFQFPNEEPLKLLLKDILEEDVEDKYYLKPEQTEKLLKNIRRSKNIQNKSYSDTLLSRDFKDVKCIQCFGSLQEHASVTEDYSSTLSSAMGKGGGQTPIVSYIDVKDLIGLKNRNFSSSAKVLDTESISPTLQACMGNGGNQVNYVVSCTLRSYPRTNNPIKDKEIGRFQNLEIGKEFSNTISSVQKDSLITNSSFIRKLTPKECFRLQGYLNDDIDLSNLSDTQKYRLAGNGVSINVTEKIFRKLFK